MDIVNSPMHATPDRSKSKFTCPACGFLIFNRRVPTCESCRAALPVELLYSQAEIAKYDAEYEASLRERETRLRNEKARTRADAGDYGGDGFVDSGGDSD